MSAVMQTGPAPAQGAPAPATVAGPVTQVRVVRSEWMKLLALRSTRWSALTAIVLIVGLGAIVARHLGEFPAKGWIRLLASGVAGKDWFGGAQGLDLLARMASA